MCEHTLSGEVFTSVKTPQLKACTSVHAFFCSYLLVKRGLKQAGRSTRSYWF